MNQQPKPFVGVLKLVFFLMMVLPTLLRYFSATGGTGSTISLLFRAAVMLVGVVGTVTLLIYEQVNKKKQGKPAAAPPTLAAPLPPGAISQSATGNANPWDTATRQPVGEFNLAAPAQPYRAFPYASTRSETIGCEWYAMTHFRPALVTLFVPPVLASLLFVSGFARGDGAASALKIAATFAAWLLFLFVTIVLTMRKNYPRADTVRSSTIVLTSDGIYDVLPEKQIFAPWSALSDVRLNEHGAFVFHAKGASYVPRQSFEGGETAAQAFYHTAQCLWKSGGSEWPREVPPVLPNADAGA